MQENLPIFRTKANFLSNYQNFGGKNWIFFLVLWWDERHFIWDERHANGGEKSYFIGLHSILPKIDINILEESPKFFSLNLDKITKIILILG